MNPLNLFFSYGHEEKNKAIVDIIREKMEKERHHNVWIDTKNIPIATDWRRKIQEGISDSDGVLAFLSQHAVRKINGTPGVCLDELSIAISYPEVIVVTILLESENEVDMPPTVSSIQRLDMSDWREKYETGGKVFEEYLEAKFALILEALENDFIFSFHSEIEGLRKTLLPEMSRSRYNQLINKPMVGRSWLIDAFNEYASDRDAKRFFCVYGGPGYGKSHFISNVMHYNSQVIAGYFFEWSAQDPFSVQKFICTVAFQMATKLPDYRLVLIERLKKENSYISSDKDGDIVSINAERMRKELPAVLFKKLISDIIFIDGQRDNKLIAIDAVDEAFFDGRNPLVDFLCSDIINQLPDWLKIVVTTRDERDICLRFQSVQAVNFNLDDEKGKDDIKKYLLFRLNSYIQSGKITSDITDWISKRCENTFVFAEKLCDAFEEDASLFQDLNRLPVNINGLYFNYFERLFKECDYEEIRDKLSVIISNNGEISERMFCGILDMNEHMLALFLEKMRSFIKIAVKENARYLTFSHKTIGEWLADKDLSGKYVADNERGRSLILGFCERKLEFLKDASFSWGFDGKKSILSYETLKFIYEKISDFGTGKMKIMLQTDMRFFYCFQLEAYINSELRFSEEIHNELKRNYSFMSSSQKIENERYYVGSVFLNCENKIAKGCEDVLEFLEEQKERFAECLEKEMALYRIVESNICFLMRKRDIAEAERRLYALMDDVCGRDYAEKFSDIAMIDYMLSVVLYDSKKYAEALKRAREAVELAESFNEEPMKLCLLAFNQIGSCYQKMCEQSTDPEEKKKLVALQKEFKEKSLNSRISNYGKYSRFTALAYDYMARTLLDYCRVYGQPLDETAYEYAENGLKISSYVLGEQSILYARALQTKALLKEFEGDFEEAFGYADKSREIFFTFSDAEKASKKTAEAIADRIFSKLSGDDNK